jgi:hypothetical protein
MDLRRASWLFERQAHLELLAAPPGLSGNALEKACRRARALHHPDRGGDPGVAAIVNAAADAVLARDKMCARTLAPPFDEMAVWRHIEQELWEARRRVEEGMWEKDGGRSAMDALADLLQQMRACRNLPPHARAAVLLARDALDAARACQKIKAPEPPAGGAAPAPVSAKRAAVTASQRSARVLRLRTKAPQARGPLATKDTRSQEGVSVTEARVRAAGAQGLPGITAALRTRLDPHTLVELEELRRQYTLIRRRMQMRKQRGSAAGELGERLQELACEGWRLLATASHQKATNCTATG